MSSALREPVILDTSVVVAGLLTSASEAPTARLLDGLLEARFPFLLSVDLMAEYRRVLLRPRIAERHGLSVAQIDIILLRIAENAMVTEPEQSASAAPDPGDQHLWELLAASPGSILVTGDKRLLGSDREGWRVISPAKATARLGL